MPFSPRFSAADAQVLERDAVYEGFFSFEKLRLKHRLFGGGWSQPLSREMFNRGDAVAVLPWDPIRDELILVEQFRPGALREQESPWMLELVAGMVADGETDSDVAKREALEEAGCALDQLQLIATFYPSAGACSEQIRAFVSRVVSAGVGEIHGLADEHEDLLVHAIPRAEAFTMLDANKINNGHTLIALQWLARHGETLREQWLSN